ncbi:MAG: hypothetical protein Kow006_08240 [Gammaproteobacteria bacterium]
MSEHGTHYLKGATSEEEAPSLLRRWSARKQAVREAEREHRDQESSRCGEALQPSPSAVETSEPSLPPLEAIDADSDCSGFLSPEVDESLRKLALRKLFHAADFNVVDGLNEYDEDFTLFEPLGDIVPHNLKRWREEAQKRIAEETAPPTAAGESMAQAEADEGRLEPPATDGDPALEERRPA